MSHHDHHHDYHDHHHDHAHDHHHDHHEHETSSNLSFEGKMSKLLEHWIKHNTDHAQNYKDWAEKASENNMPEVSALLKDIMDMTVSMNEKFEEALRHVKK